MDDQEGVGQGVRDVRHDVCMMFFLPTTIMWTMELNG